MKTKLHYIVCVIAGIFYAMGYPGIILPQCFLLPIIGFIVLDFSLNLNQSQKKTTSSLKKKACLNFLFLSGANFFWVLLDPLYNS